MAELKKYLDTTALGTLVDQIKAEDAKTLQSAKDYCDAKDKLFESSGAAATAESNAKAYTDELANGQVKTNTEAIAKLNGDASTEGSVAKAVADAKATIDADVDAVESIANQNKSDIAAINNADTGILAQAKKYADDEDAKVEESVAAVAEDVAALEKYVGTIPEGATATDIVGYVQEKTAGIATDAALGELQAAVDAVEADIATVKGDYLKAADKTELQGNIDAEAATRKADDEALAARIKVVEDDYLKAADKTELENSIAANASAIELLTNGVSADEVDGVNDLIQYVKDHGTEVTAMQGDIADNASAIEGVAGRMTTAEGKITTLEGAVATKAEQSALDEAVESLEAADSDLSDRLDAVEAQLGDGENSVSDLISDAKQEAVDTAAADATTKANAAQAAAIAKAEELDEAMDARMDVVEAKAHEHANKAELDLIVSGDKAKWDAVAAIAHEHANKTVLDGITAEKITAWDAAEQNAKTYADGLNAAMTTKVDGVDARVKTLEETIVDKADADDLDAAVVRIAANEAAIVANTSAINSFTAITSAEVEALFA